MPRRALSELCGMPVDVLLALRDDPQFQGKAAQSVPLIQQLAGVRSSVRPTGAAHDGRWP
jgi:hypothetical protein